MRDNGPRAEYRLFARDLRRQRVIYVDNACRASGIAFVAELRLSLERLAI